MNLTPTFQSLHTASRVAPLTIEQRRTALKAIAHALSSQAAQACMAVDADFQGRHADETRLLELAPSQQGIKHALKHLKAWAAPRRAGVSLNFLPAKNCVIPQSLGVVGIVVPWNYPIYLTIGPITTALAAGNRVMIKVSEHTPQTGQFLTDLLHGCLPADVCQVVQGGVEVAQAFCALPFDHLLFTGSTALGPAVMGAAAQNLTPVTLELGGKSPAIVGAGADIAHAARRIAVGKWRHAGQTCIAPDYVLVHRSQYQALIDALMSQADKLYPDALYNPAYSSIINDRQFNRLQAWVDEAAAQGAQIQSHGAFSDAARHRIAPAVVTDCPKDSKLMREEIFGPLLPVLPFDTLDEAIAQVNAHARPLALYVFERDAAAIAQVLNRTVAGGVSVNETIVHIAQEDLPFGGVGQSGMGHYHGQWGFDTFSKLKPVFYQSRWNGLGLLDPPHSKLFHTIVRYLIKP
jgi:coniferyl-aldehyde dehydrogenase